MQNYNRRFLKEIMDILNLSIGGCARKLDISHQTVSRILNIDNYKANRKEKKIIHGLRYNLGVINPEVFLQPGNNERPKIVIENQLRSEVKTMNKITMEFFGLQSDPFESPKIVHPDDQWMNNEFDYLLQKILSAAESQEFFCIVGSVGSGKSNLMFKAKNELQKIEGIRVSYLPPLVVKHMDDKSIMSKIIKDIGESKPLNEIDNRAVQLAEELYNYENQGIRIVILIDEAHHLPIEGFRSLKILMESSSHVSIILAAQPRISEVLSSIELAEIDERLPREYISSFRLKEVNHQNVKNYIEHKLHVSGTDKEIFSTDVIQRIGEVANTPLHINNICKAAMINAAKIRSEIDIEIIESVIQRMLNAH
ncbi:MAG: AAA family ATPase [Candidatus Aminicenantes bacterium]|jgi:MSHA biogenesis protein MshM